MNALRTMAGRSSPRRGFTLTELLVVIMVISILASTVLFTMYQAVEQAKVSRAQTQVTKLHELLMARWESYRTRPVRLLQVSAPGTAAQPVSVIRQVRRDPRAMAIGRLNAIRDLMRMEMPDRKLDVLLPEATHTITYFQRDMSTVPPTLVPAGNVDVKVMRPALSREYLRRANSNTGGNPAANWSEAHQGAECLYLIIASMRDVTGTGLDFLQEGEVGDVDGDGMSEILDPWGNPIAFLRWAPGYVASPGLDGQWGEENIDDDGNGVTDDFWEAWDRTSVPGEWIPGGYGDDQPMITPMVLSPDPTDPTRVEITDTFNPLRIDPSQIYSNFDDYPRNFTLYPLVFSAGPDELYDINIMRDLNYPNLTPKNHPYYVPFPPVANPYLPAGVPMDADGDGQLSFMDNITNHAIETR
jgi:prepilin-type N-terminal cleavage/methylation domain-containing protein